MTTEHYTDKIMGGTRSIKIILKGDVLQQIEMIAKEKQESVINFLSNHIEQSAMFWDFQWRHQGLPITADLGQIPPTAPRSSPPAPPPSSDYDGPTACGEVVRLRSGGRTMTVISVDCLEVECAWFDNIGNFHEHTFPPSALEVLDENPF